MLKLLLTAAEVSRPDTDRMRKAFVGAVALRTDRVLVYSRNGSTAVNSAQSPSVHAERRLLRKCGHGAEVYVARVLRNGQLALAKPCDYCRASLRAQGIKMVYYTISDDEWGGFIP